MYRENVSDEKTKALLLKTEGTNNPYEAQCLMDHSAVDKPKKTRCFFVHY